jgi:predicted ATP-dependent endonuclease of OLD family
MKITEIAIENYRGIKSEQRIPLNKFSSIIGKNDSGKSIVLNAIASFLNIKDYPVSISDFNDTTAPVVITCTFSSDDISEILETKIKSKIKKADGLDEFIADILISGQLSIKKTISSPKKTFDAEQILMMDYVPVDFAFLYSKSDDELNNILSNHGITVPVQGSGRNSKLEKIKTIKEHCTAQAIERHNCFIDDEYKICSLLPDVELFKADYGLEADTKFKSNSVSEIIEYFDNESQEEKKLAIVEAEIAAEMQKEALSVKGYMEEYVSNLQKVEIKPTIVWKDAIKSVDVSFQFDGDEKPIPMSHKGAGYRRLFMVARFRYLAKKNKGLKVIYLIEEPETFLHPSAQNDLLNAFRDLSEDNQVIIATHSPVFAGATHVESVILCKRETGSVYETCNTNGKEAFITAIVSELGIKPSYNLRDSHEKIVFVESHNDAHFFHLLCKNLINKDLLHNEKILVLPFGGGEDIDSFLNIDYFDSSGRALYLIIDSDKHTNNLDKQTQRAQDFNSRKPNGKAYVLNKSCIENYYHPRAFERHYGLVADSFPLLGEADSVKSLIKAYKADNGITQNVKEKNNFEVFEIMTQNEWEEVTEPDLIAFLQEITE